ncbi:MAG: FAD-binding oxidoreductase [Candidatus Odinarchaeota archaeon]
MTLPEEAYFDLKTVVGPENISQEPAVLDSYCCHATNGGIPRQGLGVDIWWKRADAIVLPGSTKEVQQIVNICNHYGVKFKAHSTGQLPTGFPQSETNVITIDLRRMNRIIEINEQFMYALIEPYVTQAELFIETIKHGMCPNMIDAGASISPLASITSVLGNGDSSITRSMNARNALAVEWILPTGEILRLGTPNTPNAGWFSGDGPGPSLRGTMRGGIGLLGSRGIFTKVAMKLYPWHGPKKLEAGGHAPWWEVKEWPLSELVIFKWDDYKNEADGLYLIGEAEIFDSLGRLSTTKFEATIAESKGEWASLRRWNIFGELFPKGGWFGQIISINQEHLDYCKSVLKRILDQTNGKIVKVEDITVPEGSKINNPEQFAWRCKQIYLQLILFKDYTLKACEMPMAGTFGPLPAMYYSNIDTCFKLISKYHIPIKTKYQKKGSILDDGPDGNWATIEENGHMMQFMNFTRIERKDPNADSRGLGAESMAKAFQDGYLPYTPMPPIERIMLINKYQRKLDEKLNPYKTAEKSSLLGQGGFSPGSGSGDMQKMAERFLRGRSKKKEEKGT